MQKMLDYINCGQIYNNLESTNILKNKLEYPLFKGWNIIIGKKVELIVDNYKIKALKEYLHHLKLLKNVLFLFNIVLYTLCDYIM